MKKITIFLGLIGIAIISIGAYIGLTPVASAEVSTTSTYNTTIPATTTEQSTSTFTDNGKVYTYTDYNDLVNQIYQDVYNDVYDQVYQDVIDSLTPAYYQQIYDNVQSQLTDLLTQQQIGVYVDTFQQKIHDVVGISNQSVIGIENLTGSSATALGSGVIFQKDNSTYYVITNHHVIDGGDNFRVVFKDGSYRTATLLGYDTEVDIAILTFDGSNLDNLVVSQLGDSDTLTTGSVVIAAGNPRGFDFYGSVTMGLVSGLDRQIQIGEYVKYIQHDASINEGNSGGPIYDLDGNVVGINVSKFVDTNIEGMGFAIPINLVERVIARVEDGTISNYNTIMPRLGADFYDISEINNNGQVTVDNIMVNNVYKSGVTITLPNNLTTGLMIYNIDPALMLGVANLKSGDIIYQVDNHIVLNAEDYYSYVYSHYESGDSVTIHYYRFNPNTLNYDTALFSKTVTFR